MKQRSEFDTLFSKENLNDENQDCNTLG